MLEISITQRRDLRAQAPGLNPVVTISQNGLTEAVLREISRSLDAHELIKIRVFGDERELRDSYLKTICDTLNAAPVQHIGKLLVIWRPAPADKNSEKSKRGSRPELRRTKRSFQGE